MTETGYTVSPVSGSNNSAVTVTASSANTSATARSATVTISASGAPNQTVTVTQTGTVILSVSPATVSLAAASGASGTFNITSNTAWTISDDGAWLTVSPVSGSNNSAVTVTAGSANTSATARSATVTISASGAPNQTVTVTQAGILILTSSPSSVLLGSASGSNGIFNITSNLSWTVTDDGSWLTVSPASGSNNSVVTITASSANTNYTSRTATVTVSASGAPNQTVTVIQAGTAVVFNIYDPADKILRNNDTIKIISSDAGSLSLRVECSADWNVTENSLWLNTIQESSTSLKVDYTENISILKKVASIKLNYPPASELVIRIEQKARISNLRDSKFGKINMYPNPANDVLNLDFQEETFENIIISVIDIYGHILLVKDYPRIENQVVGININYLPVGQYLIRIGDNFNVKTFRMIKF